MVGADSYKRLAPHELGFVYFAFLRATTLWITAMNFLPLIFRQVSTAALGIACSLAIALWIPAMRGKSPCQLIPRRYDRRSMRLI